MGRSAVVITLPRAVWGGLRKRRLVVLHFHEVDQQVGQLDFAVICRRWARGDAAGDGGGAGEAGSGCLRCGRRRCRLWKALFAGAVQTGVSPFPN